MTKFTLPTIKVRRFFSHLVVNSMFVGLSTLAAIVWCFFGLKEKVAVHRTSQWPSANCITSPI